MSSDDAWGNDPVQTLPSAAAAPASAPAAPAAATAWGNDPVQTRTPDGDAIPTVTITADPDHLHKPQPPPVRSATTDVEQFGHGLLDPLVGAAQLGGNVVVPPINAALRATGVPAQIPDVNKYVQQRETDIRAETPIYEWSGGGTTTDAQGRASHQPRELVDTTGADVPRTLGNMASSTGAALAIPELGGAKLGGRILNAAIQGGAVGAAQPVASDNYWNRKTREVGGGILFGGATPLVGSGVRNVGGAVAEAVTNWLSPAKRQAAVENKAVQAVLDRVMTKRRGALALDDMLDLVALTPDAPLVLADMPGADLKGLVGRIARTPGEARDIMANTVINRDLDAGLRLSTAVGEHFGEGAKYYIDRALKDARSAAAKPLFDAADAGGSIAPLEKLFEDAFAKYDKDLAQAQRDVAHASDRLTHAAARETQAAQWEAGAANQKPLAPGDNVYGVSGARQDLWAAQAEMKEATERVDAAIAGKELARTILKQAQWDRTAGVKGAVWSPRLQELLDQPEVKEGVKRGWHIERRESVGEDRPPKFSEYAIIGMDNHGDPIVGSVPTFKMLRLAKEGLDAKIEEFRDPVTRRLNDLDKTVISYKTLRDGLVAEMDRLNPDYKPARDVWSGYSSSITALNNGQNVFNLDPSVIKDAFSTMTDNEKQFWRLGAASKMREMINKTAEQGDEARRFVGSRQPGLQMREMFDDQTEFDKWFQKLNSEHMMFKTWRKAYGGSETAERLAEDFSPNLGNWTHFGKMLWQAGHGNLGSAISHGAKMLPESLTSRGDAIAEEQAKLLVTPVPEAVDRLRKALQTKPQPIRQSPWLAPAVTVATQPGAGGNE